MPIYSARVNPTASMRRKLRTTVIWISIKATSTINVFHPTINAGNRRISSKILKTVVHAIRGKY